VFSTANLNSPKAHRWLALPSFESTRDPL
jgi:hypothetical protein